MTSSSDRKPGEEAASSATDFDDGLEKSFEANPGFFAAVFIEVLLGALLEAFLGALLEVFIGALLEVFLIAEPEGGACLRAGAGILLDKGLSPVGEGGRSLLSTSLSASSKLILSRSLDIDMNYPPKTFA